MLVNCQSKRAFCPKLALWIKLTSIWERDMFLAKANNAMPRCCKFYSTNEKNQQAQKSTSVFVTRLALKTKAVLMICKM